VVEDGEAVRAALVAGLEQLGYRTLEAANGVEAMAVMEERGEQVGLVLSDVVMPEMGGKALFHALEGKGWQTPVILLTGHSMGKELDELRAQGLAAWLPKPPRLERLAQAVADVLRDSPRQG
jgi:CheY-like chemotaxis protein